MTSPRILVVTNFATHYRAPLYELMNRRLGAEFIFFSEGGEDYWQPHLGVTEGRFPAKTVVGGPALGKLRLNTELWRKLHSRDYDVIIKCMNGRLELPMAYLASRSQDAAFVLWTGMWMHPRTTFHALSRPWARYIYRHADAVVTYGDHVSQFVVSEGASQGRVFSAANAINNAMYSREVAPSEISEARVHFGLGDGPVVLAVSRLVEQKGLERLLEAAGAIPGRSPQVLVVGTGPLAERLTERATTLGVRLVLAGGLQPHEMPPIYALAAAFVMPSVTTRTFKEPWGLACNEAMCQGVPVVATDAVGAVAGGLIADGETGLVVPEGDTRALATAIERLLHEPELAMRLGDAGRERVKKVNYDDMVDAFAGAIEHSLHRRGGRA